MKNHTIFICILTFFIPNLLLAQEFIVLPNGHSHNDYTRDRPLFDALDYGFTSIEVDVFWHNERMVVTHDDKRLDEKPTIQELYLDPLRKLIRQNEGHVFESDSSQVVLMVDLKSDKKLTYFALKEIFRSYLDIIEWYRGDQLVPGPVKVVLSGQPPVDIIQSEPERYFSVDGSIDQWGEDYLTSLMPRASVSYQTYFRWAGDGEMPEAELAKLRELVQLAHSRNRKVRFWACPNNVAVWTKLMDEGVDWINVDDLKGFSSYYRQRTKAK